MMKFNATDSSACILPLTLLLLLLLMMMMMMMMMMTTHVDQDARTTHSSCNNKSHIYTLNCRLTRLLLSGGVTFTPVSEM